MMKIRNSIFLSLFMSVQDLVASDVYPGCGYDLSQKTVGTVRGGEETRWCGQYEEVEETDSNGVGRKGKK